MVLHAPPDVDPVSAGVPADFPLELTVRRITDRTLDLVPRESTPNLEAVADFLDGADGVGLSLLLNPTVHDREAAAIRSVRDAADRRATVVGAADASFAAERAVETERRDDQLNETQTFAAAAGLYAEDVCCIHGPPGTGKTRVLVEIVRRAVAAGDRVLVCADSNQGVDNAVVGESTRDHLDESSLHYFAAVEEEFELDRHRECHSNRPLVREAYDGDPRNPDVVATTNNSAADYPDGAFDLAVVDEATQATTASGLVPLTKADAVVLAGDHKQLPPYEATDEPPTDEWDRSLFEHFYDDDGVYGPSVGVFLSTQYRMHEDIAAFPNHAFYGGTLRNGADVPPVDDLPPAVGLDVSGSEREDGDGSYANPAEATAVGRLVERLLDADVDAGDVGVITPYRAQRRTVRSELDGLSVPDGDAVTVDTVDSFQGGEREAVVVSFVRSNDRGDVGFLGREQDGPRRLNVALTRAERFCGLVGDWDTLRNGGDGRNACANLYRDLYERVASADRLGLDEYA